MAPKSKAARKSGAVHMNNPGGSRTSGNQAPDWPPIQPLVPSTDLFIETVLPDQILTVSRLWTRTLCEDYVTFLSKLAMVTTPGRPKKGEAVRVNDRYQVDDPQFAQRLWELTALRELVATPVIDGKRLTEHEGQDLWGGEVLGLNSNIRIYRYVKGQFFDQHYDESNNVYFPNESAPNRVPAKTTWTLLLYLSSAESGCRGGETVFYPEAPSKRDASPPPIIAEPVIGMALLHRHGKDCLLHEGREVTAGEKWVIRSDLCVRR